MRVPILRLAARTLVLAASLTPAFAQAPAPQAQQPAQPAGAPANPSTQRQNSSDFIDSRTANSQNLAKAEQEDEEYVFRHSDSVRAFAKMFHLSPEAASMVFWSLNAVLLFVFVGYFLVTGLPKAFRSRRQQLDRQIVEARAATEKAEERLRTVEERLGRLDSEIAAVREQAERDSAHDEVRIKQAMEDEKKKIVASAEQEIAAAGAAAERRLRKFAAEMAIDRASSRLHLTEGDDRTLIQEFASSLGSDGSKGGRN
ncbi:MAG: F-type H+-transporting ATPase subunit b [Acidobacteriaceae bacterium]|nr:F-type H+-transporting ATPase subunit b [Acidobacteriaceae bacterium]